MPAGDKFNISGPAKRVLIAPLDWGLGHATRCIPIIRELMGLGCEVIIAAEKSTESLLKKEFPSLGFVDLKGYRVHYSSSANSFALAILLQMPKMLLSVYREQRWLKKVVKIYRIDAVISDNRPGLYHKEIPSIYITHQLQIRTGNSLTERWAQKIHYRFIKKYSVCWVPDFEGPVNLAGALSHPRNTDATVTYIGGLSRFEKLTVNDKQLQLLILLSGPEPQRTILENNLLHELEMYNGPVLLVRGLPGSDEALRSNNEQLKIVNHLPAHELNAAICNAALLICRSGYTTVMDLVKLKKRAVLIPTPGQTEQEYLAKYLEQQQFFFTATQSGFDLQSALSKEKMFNYIYPELDMDQYKKHVKQFVRKLQIKP